MNDFDASYQQWVQDLEQREALIDALIAGDILEFTRNPSQLAEILRGGCTGYEHCPDNELIADAKTRGLTI